MNALILVDLQNDFTPATDDKPEGALAVPDGNAVVPIINQLLPRFSLVIATQDWHPPDHLSFASQHPGNRAFSTIELDGLPQTLWPDHCVQQTQGAQFLPDLDTGRIDHIIRKGTDPIIDSYSAFYDNGHRQATGLAAYLNDHQAKCIYICGLATEVSVKYTALDGAKLGYETHVIKDACRGVDMRRDDSRLALTEMRDAGAKIVTSSDWLQPTPP